VGDKILLTGVCYIHRLLEERYSKNSHSYIKRVHPDFNAENVLFFREDIAARFCFTDFHGHHSSIETRADNLPALLELYENECQLMYCVFATQIIDIDVASIQGDDFRKVSAGWYFLFDSKWNPRAVERWAEKRNKVILKLLNRFPKLKFIFYQPQCRQWWEKMGLPSSRMMYWNIDWGMSREQYAEIKAALDAQGIHGGHRYPTEDSYNHLCDMIMADSRAAGLEDGMRLQAEIERIDNEMFF